MRAIFSLLSNILITGTSIIGCCTIINKVGKFFKTMEETKNDGFKVAFDGFMMESIDEINKCVESLSTIVNNFNNSIIVVYDIIVGNKFIKKNKDGKIIICNKTKMFIGYKDKIDELTVRVKKYQDELKKFKKNKSKNNTRDDYSSDSSISSDDSSILSNDSNDSIDGIDDKDKHNNNMSDDEFTIDDNSSKISDDN